MDGVANEDEYDQFGVDPKEEEKNYDDMKITPLEGAKLRCLRQNVPSYERVIARAKSIQARLRIPKPSLRGLSNNVVLHLCTLCIFHCVLHLCVPSKLYYYVF